MAVRRVSPVFAYGMGDNLIQVPPRPIIAKRAPTTADLAELGTLWVDTTTGTYYGIASIVAGGATWTTTPAAGATTLTDLDITGVGGLDVQNAGSTTTISSVVVNFDNAGALTSIAGDLTIAGVTTITGDLDLTSAALIDLTSTLNADPSIYLHANGGAAETIRLRADQGTAVDSVDLVSDVGGITLTSGLASDDAINLNATAGGVDIDGILQINIATSEAAADAIRIDASNAGGGIDIDCGTTGIAIDTTGAFSVAGAAASDITIGGAGIDLTLESTLGRVIVNAEEAAADAITVLSAAGGLDANVALQMNLDSSQVAADAVRIIASDAAGGIDIDCGTGEITVDSTAGFSIDGATASNVTVTGASEDLTLGATGGSINITATEAAADAIIINASDAAGGLEIQAGTNGILIGNQADCSIIDAGNFAPTAARSITIGGGTVVTAAVTDTIEIGPDGATTNANSIKVVNVASGDVTTGENNVNINTGTAASGTQATNIATGTGGGTKTVNVGNADGLTTCNIDAITLINDSVDVATSINTGTSTGTVSVGNALAGAITLDTAAGVSIDGATASNVTVTGASEDLTLAATGGSVNITATEAAADAIVLNSSDAAGGIDLTTGGGEISINATGGNVTATPGTATVAGVALTVNSRVFVAKFTGNVTAAGADLDLDITNAFMTPGVGILCTVSNQGSNDADILCEGVNTETNGHLILHCINAGPASLNDTVTVTGWIIN